MVQKVPTRNQGAHGHRPSAARAQARADGPRHALSFIRTVTVGPGVSPGLLTPTLLACAWRVRALAGLCSQAAITAGGEFHPALRTLCRPWGGAVDFRGGEKDALSRGYQQKPGWPSPCGAGRATAAQAAPKPDNRGLRWRLRVLGGVLFRDFCFLSFSVPPPICLFVHFLVPIANCQLPMCTWHSPLFRCYRFAL